MTDSDWECPCGETDVMKHDLGMAFAHIVEVSEQEGRDLLVRIRTRFGLDTPEEDRVV